MATTSSFSKTAQEIKSEARISMLGGFEIEANGVTITENMNRSHKLWSVLCYLIIHRNRKIPRSELISHFWAGKESSDPDKALKMLLHRAKILLEPLFGSQIPPIISHQGTCTWNPQIACVLDFDLFQSLCQQANAENLSTQERLSFYQKAFSLYHGDMLPKQSSHLWVIPLQTYYHKLYLEMVKKYASLAEEEGDFDTMYQICEKASQIDSLDENLYVLMIRALLGQGQPQKASLLYDTVADMLYRNLHTRPSAELRALHSDYITSISSPEDSLELLQHELMESNSHPGPLVCDYEAFKNAYRLRSARLLRKNIRGYIALVTVIPPDAASLSKESLTTIMNQLIQSATKKLRCGDVISSYSQTQLVVLFHTTSSEDASLMINQIIADFHDVYGKNYLTLTHRLIPLESVDWKKE